MSACVCHKCGRKAFLRDGIALTGTCLYCGNILYVGEDGSVIQQIDLVRQAKKTRKKDTKNKKCKHSAQTVEGETI